MPQPPFLGLDVARDHLDLAVHPTQDAWRVPNTPAGHAALVCRARALQPARIVLEASGGYERAVDAALTGAGLPALGEPLFLRQEGYPLTRGSLYLCIRRLRARCGIPRLTVHLFRHTFAVSYLKAGGDVLTLQWILGHTSLRMVNHYVHLAHSDVVARHRRHSPVDRLQLPRAVDRVTRGRARRRRQAFR